MNRSQTTISLRLFIAGGAASSAAARTNLEKVVSRLAPVAVELEVVDVLRQPARALADAVFVTPTLLRVQPPPRRTMIGTLQDLDQLAHLIGEG